MYNNNPNFGDRCEEVFDSWDDAHVRMVRTIDCLIPCFWRVEGDMVLVREDMDCPSELDEEWERDLEKSLDEDGYISKRELAGLMQRYFEIEELKQEEEVIYELRTKHTSL